MYASNEERGGYYANKNLEKFFIGGIRMQNNFKSPSKDRREGLRIWLKTPVRVCEGLYCSWNESSIPSHITRIKLCLSNLIGERKSPYPKIFFERLPPQKKVCPSFFRQAASELL